MPENNFEKQVQQKLDDVTITPSAEVWQKVAVTIEKRKGSRRIFAIGLLLVLFTGAATFILFKRTADKNISNGFAKNSNNNELDADKKSAKRIPTQTITAPTITTKPSAEKHSGDSESNGFPTTKKLNSRPGSPNVKSALPFGVNELNNAKATLESFYTSGKDNYNTNAKVNTSVIPADVMDLPNKEIDSNSALMAMPDKMILVLTDDVIANNDLLKTIDVDELYKNEYPRNLLTVAKNDASAKVVAGLNEKSPWKMGFNFSAGVTATTQGYLGIIGTNSEELKNNDPISYSGIGNNTQSPAVVYYPSKIKTGIGFTAGVFGEKNISQKIKILLGLNYKTYSSSVSTGNRVDSNYNFDRVNLGYRVGTTNNYNNKFHFIELPVTLKYNLNERNKLPLYLHMGMSLSQLIGSNALQFDTASGLYSSNNAIFNKTQLNAMAGVLISLTAHSKNPFLIGPDINISLSKIADAGLYKNRRYSYVGILMQKTIGKK
ncbi:MAG: outer membrane beta-barrel protein [Ferruginibacter sp.]